MGQERKPGRSRRIVIVLATVAVIIVLAVGLLTLLGPAVGSIFSNIISGLNMPEGTRSPVASPPPSPTATSRSLAFATPTVSPGGALTLEADANTTTSEAAATSSRPREDLTLTAVSVEVAALPVRVVDTSGSLIGDGTIRVFFPDFVEYPQTARVELELRLDNRYITPTPFGPITPLPVTPITSTPPPGRPTPTPRIPQHEESGQVFSQRMGASLICLPASFDGCDQQPDAADTRLVGLNGATWTWFVKPQADIRGFQDLRVEVWKPVVIENGPEQPDVVWTYPFQIEVRLAGRGGLNSGLVAAAVAAIALVLVGGGYLVRRRGRRVHIRLPGTRPQVFISYRRKVSWSVARTLNESLTARGADVFLDVDDINEGRFEEIIKKAIDGCDYFVLILGPGTLDSEWVVREASHAVAHDKRIIPVLIDGFDLYKEMLPASLQNIKTHNAVSLTPEFFNAGIDRICRFVGLVDPGTE